MKVGFTGTRHGMSDGQKEALAALLFRLGATELHHGDCVGADAQAHYTAMALGLRVVLHPPSVPHFRAWCVADETRDTQDFLLRNKAIVNATDMLIAAPADPREHVRSGTWSTVRFARRQGKRVEIIFP